jgi:hypothetical protein
MGSAGEDGEDGEMGPPGPAGTGITTAAQTFAGAKTFGDGILTDTIEEETATAGVSIDSLTGVATLIKDRKIYPNTSYMDHYLGVTAAGPTLGMAATDYLVYQADTFRFYVGGALVGSIAANGWSGDIDDLKLGAADGATAAIVGGTFTAEGSFVSVTGETAPDNLDGIGGGVAGMVLILRPVGTDDIVVRHNQLVAGGNNILLAGGTACTLTDTTCTLTLIFDTTLDTNGAWIEVARNVAAAGGGDVATDAIWDALGDLAVGTGANTAAKLTAGANDTILMAQSGEATGLKWVAPAAPANLDGVQAAAEGTADTYARSDHAHRIQHAIADNALVTVDAAAGAPADDEFARFTANGIEGRTAAEVTGDLAPGTNLIKSGTEAAGPDTGALASTGIAGVLYVETTAPYRIWRDNGATWDCIAYGGRWLKLNLVDNTINTDRASWYCWPDNSTIVAWRVWMPSQPTVACVFDLMVNHAGAGYGKVGASLTVAASTNTATVTALTQDLDPPVSTTSADGIRIDKISGPTEGGRVEAYVLIAGKTGV